MESPASTLELGLLLGAVLTAFALIGHLTASRPGVRLAKVPLPVGLVPVGYLCLLVVGPGVRLGAMTVVALCWAGFRVRRLAGKSAPSAGTRSRVSDAFRLAAMTWLATAPGLMVATDRAPALGLWSDAVGALLAAAGLAAGFASERTAQAAAYFRLGVASSRDQKRWGERLLAWALYAFALSTPEGWLTIFAPAVLASRRLLGAAEPEESGALSVTTPMS